MDEVRRERAVELAFEGLYWYQLARRSYYQQQEVVNYVNSQNRNASYYEASTHSYKLCDTYVAPGSGVAVATAKNLILPMADTDQAKNPYLKTDSNGNITTVRYEFGEREVKVEEIF